LHRAQEGFSYLSTEYSSRDNTMTLEQTSRLLRQEGLMPEDLGAMSVEVLR
jgi:hypothetical protein